ncbi:MAG: transposase [Elusimicrobia bacterium]|nr:transposase [Elusimicrobiota bacterium]
MPRLARAVAAEFPHHIIQRGNRRQQAFFCDEDYRLYLRLLKEWCARHTVDIWAYCLMTNHVHLIAVPQSEEGLRLAIGEAHRRYSRHVNFREGWRGHLWQGRFSSYILDESYLLAAARYIELNSVRAKIVEKPQDYPWSSARAHLSGRDDSLVKVAPLLEIIPDWENFLKEDVTLEEARLIETHERTGRPLGNRGFISKLEALLGRRLGPGRPGPKPRAAVTAGA